MNQLQFNMYTNPYVVLPNSTTYYGCNSNLNFNLFYSFSQALTASISVFSKRNKNSKEVEEQVSSQFEVIELESSQKQSQIEKIQSSSPTLEEKTENQIKNSIEKIKEIQNLDDHKLKNGSQNSIAISNNFTETNKIKPNNLETNVRFQINCPKIGLSTQEILEKKQRLMLQQVKDWGKIGKKKQQIPENTKSREVRMLFK